MGYKIFTRLLIVIVFFFSHQFTYAQQPAKKPVVTTIPKFKPPIVKSYLAAFSGIKAQCTAEEGKQIITLPLLIKDDQGFVYKISSYQFAYKRLGITEDEETGQTSPASDMVAQRFTETPLPALWLTNITEQLHKGEELYFFDIIAFDKKNRLFFAPDVKIIIQ